MKRTIGRVLPCAAVAALLGLTAGGTARADQPKPWEMWMQEPASPIAESIRDLHSNS